MKSTARFRLKLAALLTAILTGCNKNPLGLDDPVGVPGIYVDASGYDIFMLPDFIYRLCDAKDCVDGKWQYQEEKWEMEAHERELKETSPL